MRVLQPRNFRWHVDPLDGTTNFAHGYPCFCVSIALAQRDTLLAAAVFNPFTMSSLPPPAAKAQPSTARKSTSPKNATLSTSLLCTGFPVRNANLAPISILRRLHAALARRAPRRLRCPGPRLRGVRPLRWLLGIRLAKWDVAAGILLIEEAGGKVSDFAGNPYQLAAPSSSPPTV